MHNHPDCCFSQDKVGAATQSGASFYEVSYSIIYRLVSFKVDIKKLVFLILDVKLGV